MLTALSECLVDQLYTNVDVPAALSQVLPPRLRPLAGPIAVGAEPYIQRAVAAGLGRPRVAQLWRPAALHQLKLAMMQVKKSRTTHITLARESSFTNNSIATVATQTAVAAPVLL